MRLYHWDKVKAVAGHIPGDVIAYANSREEAIKLVCEDYAKSITHALIGAELRKELQATAPNVYDLPTAIVIWGSD